MRKHTFPSAALLAIFAVTSTAQAQTALGTSMGPGGAVPPALTDQMVNPKTGAPIGLPDAPAGQAPSGVHASGNPEHPGLIPAEFRRAAGPDGEQKTDEAVALPGAGDGGVNKNVKADGPAAASAAKDSSATPPTPEDLGFKALLQNILPLSPGQITHYRQAVSDTQHAMNSPVGGAPKPVTRSISLTLKPGEQQPTLHLYPGNASTLTFSDVTGKPWPVQSVTVGNPTAFMAQQAGEKGKTNMVVVSPLSAYAQANNMVITLVDHPVPIIFSLSTGERDVDYRLDVALQSRGPNAAYDIVDTTLPPTNDDTVKDFLEGIAPKGARKLHTSSGDVEVWKMKDTVYVRTPLEILSPAYVGRSRNISGYNVYTMINPPSPLLVSQDGKIHSVTVER